MHRCILDNANVAKWIQKDLTFKYMQVCLEQEHINLPAKLKFTWGCACNMHTALVFFNWPLALWAGLGIS